MARDIRSLADLNAAAQLATRDGECVVRLADGTTLTLLPGGDTYDDDQDPGLVQALEQGLDELDRGEFYSTDAVISRLRARRKDHNA